MATNFHGIKVEVISNDQTLHMYNDPDIAENRDPQKCRYYIEAVTGATFSVKISLTPEYEQGPCDAVRIKIQFDDNGAGFYRDIETYSISRKAVFSSLSQYCHQTHQWRKGTLSFGKLEIKETSDATIDLAQSLMLGSIRLKVSRINHANNIPRSPNRDLALNRVAEVSEKVLKGKAIANTVDLVDFKPGRKPASHVSGYPIAGLLGQPTIIDIFYRSKNTLKMIGCLPRTPSPGLDFKTDNPAASLDTEEELQALRARISQLERNTSIKGERSHTPAKVKRERENDVGTSIPRKRSRISESPEIIELGRCLRKPTRVIEIDLTSD